MSANPTVDLQANPTALLTGLREQARQLGFSQIGVTGVDLSDAEPGLLNWLAQGFHGDMAYMQAHGLKRARPAELLPGTVTVLTARMDYLPADTPDDWQRVEFERLARPQEGVVSLYARGRDYHKVLRQRLQRLVDWLQGQLGPFGHRVFTDSAPVLEVELAARAGLGWRGKHSLLLHRDAGSMFFLGEIYLDFHLENQGFEPTESPRAATENIASESTTQAAGSCGSCTACSVACPTQAILAPGLVDARRCISYLTIEHHGAIPEALRPLVGNRIYGCDDCQLVCPWNKFGKRSALPDFDSRPAVTGRNLADLLAWTEADFLRETQGSAIRRIGHERWLRNIAVAAGNALRQAATQQAELLVAALRAAMPTASPLVREHLEWALAQDPANPV